VKVKNRRFFLPISLVLLAGTLSFIWPNSALDDKGGVSIVVLGTIQDAGSPQIGCTKDCCVDLFAKPDHTRKVVSLGLIDQLNHTNPVLNKKSDQRKAVRQRGFNIAEIGQILEL